MRNLLVCVVMTVAVASCGKKDKPKPEPENGSGSAASSALTKACPPGNAVASDGSCTPAVTAEKITAVAQEQTRLDDLRNMLDKTDVIAAVVDFIDQVRKLDAWKQLMATSDKFKQIDSAAQTLSDGSAQLKTFRGSLGQASTKLGDLKSTLDQVMKDTGAAQSLEALRKQVSDQVRAAFEPLEKDTIALVQKVIGPLGAQLDNVSDLVISGCAAAKLTGGSDKLKEVCAQAKEVFAKATLFIGDLKTKPAELFAGVTSNLEKQLDMLIDTGAKKLIDEAQTKVNEALKAPVEGSGSGSAAH
jgi:hypothetical protein